MNSYGLMFPGVRSSLVFSGFGLKPPASSFQSYSYNSLKTSPSITYSTDDKASRLMVKKFSTVRDTQRVSQSYMEKRRWRREIEVTRSRRGGIKRGESKLASNQFLYALHSLDPSEVFTNLHREEKREEGDRGDQEEKRGNQKERDRSSQ